jgi:hypothetical protein
MKLQTIVDIQPSGWQIGYEDKILLVGSCFSDSIGQMMVQRGLQVTCNPFGTLYNPVSIAQAMLMTGIPPLVESDGLWHSMAHHGSFSRATEEETRKAVGNSIETMQRALEDATVVIVTFGTAWVYEMKDPVESLGPGISSVVGNCHKLPPERFTRRRLSSDEIEALWLPLIARYPDKYWLFTVSPIRHIKDGLHENQLSKATLLMAVEELRNTEYREQNTDRVTYFPSYEILLDELRDYRFYADDLVHPSSLAVEYIWERFVDTFCTPQTSNRMQIELKRWKQSQHRPLH